MAAQKVYQIQINGLTESVKAVDALNESLKTLESRIKALDGKSVSVGSKSSGGGSKSSALTEEEKLEKQINQLEEKRVAYSKEIYQNYLAAKDVLKEVENDQKSIAATERLQANSYSNTIQGMKQELADIKIAMQTVDLGDTDQLDKMTQRANELNDALKKIEESYGQFGRNVGNYANGVAEGLQKVKIEVGGNVREFDNAKQAAKTLGNELKTMAVNGEQNTEKFKELQKVVAQLNSDIKDATVSSRAMDNMLDTMQSITAIASVGKGIRGLFGVNESEIQKSIQNLVALQNVMLGIEKINQQINSKEGIGKWIGPFTTGVDNATKKLLVYNRALLGTGKAAKTAAVGINLFSKALKLAFTGGILIAVDYLVEKLMDLVESFKKVDKAAEDVKETEEALAKAYAEGSAKLLKYQSIVKSFNGTKKEEKKLVSELNTELGNSFGTYKTIAEWMDVLINKGADYIKMLVLQAKAQATFNNYVKALEKEQEVKNKSSEDYSSFTNQVADFINPGWGDKIRNNARVAAIQAATAYSETMKEEMLDSQKDVDSFMQKHKIGDYSHQIEKNSKKTKDTTEQVNKSLTDLELRLMKDGLAKKLRQLDEEERQTLNELKKNGRTTAAEIEKVQRQYAELREKEIEEYLKSIEEKIKASAENIKAIKFDLNIGDIENKIQKLKNQMEELSTLDMSENTFESLNSARDLNYNTILPNERILSNSFHNRYELTKKFYGDLISDLIDFIKDESALNKERIKELENQQKEAESNRYSIQMSGLTEDLKLVNNGLKEIEDRYKVSGLEEIETIKETNKEIYEQYHELFANGVEIEGLIEMAKQQHKDKLKQITEASNNAIKKNELDTQKDISLTQEKYYDLQISNFRDLQSKINAEMQRQPVTDLIGFGIVNLSRSKKNYNEIKNAAIGAVNKIKDARKKLDKDLEDGVISDEVFEATAKNLDDMELSFKQTEEAVNTDLKNLTGEFVASIDRYIQEIANSFNTIMNAVWDAQDVAFEKEQEQIDKWNDELDKALDKQQEIIEEHKSKIDSIEDELANSRGDRRQHLIDQINAEIEAQRAAEKEEQRIQKEKEAAQKKQDALDLKRKKADYDRQILQAIVNGAQAVTMAAINTWPIPAIPLMALAGATTAAQVAIMKANKPYAKGGQLDGGVAVGNRHRDGGIKVLGGRAEIEGGEFITNRISTQMNAPLLEFINSKKKRIDISDMIDFYSSGSVKKNIANVRTKFEDGGYMPTLPTALDVRDQLQNIIINQDNRPIYVSVVDINNKQEEVRKVQTLAGL